MLQFENRRVVEGGGARRRRRKWKSVVGSGIIWVYWI